MTKDEILNLDSDTIDKLVAIEIMGFDVQYRQNPFGWTPSRRIDQAWFIIQKFDTHDQKHLVWHENRGEWCFIFGKGTWGRWSAFSKEPAEAICKAALLYKYGIQSY